MLFIQPDCLLLLIGVFRPLYDYRYMVRFIILLLFCESHMFFVPFYLFFCLLLGYFLVHLISFVGFLAKILCFVFLLVALGFIVYILNSSVYLQVLLYCFHLVILLTIVYSHFSLHGLYAIVIHSIYAFVMNLIIHCYYVCLSSILKKKNHTYISAILHSFMKIHIFISYHFPFLSISCSASIPVIKKKRIFTFIFERYFSLSIEF